MISPTILTELISGKLVITVNRPAQMNALNKETLKALEHAILSVYASDNIRGAILTGQGFKSFIAGADINEFIGLTPEKGWDLSVNGQRVLKLIEDCPKPFIAAVNGFALGGGCEIAMACHLRIASENAKFGQPEVNLGIIPGYGGTQRLIQLIGKTRAMELMLTTDMISARQAETYGLVNQVTSSEELMDKAHQILDKILLRSPVAISGIINSVNAYFSEGIDGYINEAEEFKKCFTKNDFIEGVNAFIEKRKPNFYKKM
jgi:enoyl-CoA hydratase